MPIARFRMPDGRVARFEVPDGTTPEQAQSLMEAHFSGSRETGREVGNLAGNVSAPKRDKAADRAEMVKREIASFASPLRGVKDVIDTGAELLAKGYDKITGGDQRNVSSLVTGQPQGEAARVKSMNDAGKAEFAEATRGSMVAPVGRIAGNVLATAPVGGVLAAPLRTVAPRFANALASGGMTTGGAAAAGLGARAADMGIRMAGGGVAGGAMAGLVNPEDADVGATVGAVLPPGLRGASVVGGAIGRGGKALLEPFYQQGQQAIVGRAMTRAAGAEAPAVAQRLREAAAPFVGPSQGTQRTMLGEFVPGSVPTVGQAAQNPGIAALERTATAINPEVASQFGGRMAQQNAARVGMLDDLAGTQGARDFFAANRDATAKQLYDAANAKGINIAKDAASGQFQTKAQIAGTKAEITKLLQRPAIQDAMKEARKLAANEGVSMKDMTGSVKGLDYVKRALDDQISKSTGNEQRVLVDLKNRLLTTLDRLSPDYAAARTTFRDMSRPINQMDIAAELRDRSVNALNGNLQPAAFARNLTDDTAARATGFKAATLENTLEPAQMNQLNAILADVQRANAAMNGGRGPGSDTVQKLAYSNMLEQAGIPTFLREMKGGQIAGNVLGRVGDVAYGRQNREIANLLAESMLDPRVAAQMMEIAQRSGQTNALLRALSNSGVGQVGYRTAPALLASPQ